MGIEPWVGRAAIGHTLDQGPHWQTFFGVDRVLLAWFVESTIPQNHRGFVATLMEENGIPNWRVQDTRLTLGPDLLGNSRSYSRSWLARMSSSWPQRSVARHSSLGRRAQAEDGSDAGDGGKGDQLTRAAREMFEGRTPGTRIEQGHPRWRWVEIGELTEKPDGFGDKKVLCDESYAYFVEEK